MYTFESRVRFSEADHTELLTLPGLVNYFQDCSTFQSEDIGYGVESLKKSGQAWILSAWQIVVNRYPKLGEHIRVSTWATDFTGLFGLRNFKMEDEAGEMTAWANSVWVYMDMKKGSLIVDAKSLLGLMNLGLQQEVKLQVYEEHCEDLKEAVQKFAVPHFQ